MKYLFIVGIIGLFVLSGCTQSNPIVGGDVDEYGCKASAGYTWCEEKEKCLRTWEEPCTIAVNSFAECVAAGNPIMESYPRQCSANGQTFTEIIEHVCTEEESLATVCTADYNPVCGKSILNSGNVVYQTFGNGCSACAAMKVVSYIPGECPPLANNTMPPVGCSEMTETEAFDIAKASECGDNFKCSCPEGYMQEGSVCNPECYYATPQCGAPSIQCSQFLTCNEGTKTYWIDLTLEKEGCNPACVIDVETKTAEINWRCTGLII